MRDAISNRLRRAHTMSFPEDRAAPVPVTGACFSMARNAFATMDTGETGPLRAGERRYDAGVL